MKIEHEINEQQIADMMVGAIEGGSSYWCSGIHLVSVKNPESLWYSNPETYKSDFVTIKVIEDDPSSEMSDGIHYIDKTKMEKAFQLMAEFGNPKGFHLRNLLEENWDSETADVFLQLATFGEVVYG